MKESLALSPVSASYAGYHKHPGEAPETIELDALLDDVSPAAFAEQRRFYAGWRERFAKETPRRVARAAGRRGLPAHRRPDRAEPPGAGQDRELQAQPHGVRGADRQRALPAAVPGVRAEGDARRARALAHRADPALPGAGEAGRWWTRTPSSSRWRRRRTTATSSWSRRRCPPRSPRARRCAARYDPVAPRGRGRPQGLQPLDAGRPGQAAHHPHLAPGQGVVRPEVQAGDGGAGHAGADPGRRRAGDGRGAGGDAEAGHAAPQGDVRGPHRPRRGRPARDRENLVIGEVLRRISDDHPEARRADGRGEEGPGRRSRPSSATRRSCP